MVTNPLLTISRTVSGFKYENDSDRASNLEDLKNLSITQKNEIGVLYDALVAAEKDSAFYLTSYRKAEDELHVKDEGINKLGILALRDDMTNVGNHSHPSLLLFHYIKAGSTDSHYCNNSCEDRQRIAL